jgi:hypothetical protein
MAYPGKFANLSLPLPYILMLLLLIPALYHSFFLAYALGWTIYFVGKADMRSRQRRFLEALEAGHDNQPKE